MAHSTIITRSPGGGERAPGEFPVADAGECQGRVYLLHLEPYSSNQCQTLAVARGLRREGWDARIVCRASCALAGNAKALGLLVHTLPDEGCGKLSLIWKFLRIVNQRKNDAIPSLVHACDPSASQLASAAWRWNKKLRIVHTRRVPIMESNHKAIRCYQIPQAKVITDSLAGKIALRLSGLEPHLLHTIACGLDPEQYPARRERHDGRFVYALTGELMPLRGHAEMYAAIPLLDQAAALPPWEVRVLGEGPFFTKLLEEAASLGVDRRLAFLSGMDPAVELSKCDALVLPASDGETYLPRILEGWAAETPVITVNRLDHGEILQDGGNCLLAQPGDIQGLAERMRRIALEPVLRKRLVEGGKASLQKFTLSALVAGHRRLYRETLA